MHLDVVGCDWARLDAIGCQNGCLWDAFGWRLVILVVFRCPIVVGSINGNVLGSIHGCSMGIRE